jgi:DNA polymerase-3 subunit alpha
VVQLAWQLHDFNGTLIEQRSAIILPEDFEIPYAASKIHHITTAWALAKGEPFLQVIQEFLKAFKRATCYVGHNIEFDRMVLGCVLLRSNLNGPHYRNCIRHYFHQHLKMHIMPLLM